MARQRQQADSKTHDNRLDLRLNVVKHGEFGAPCPAEMPNNSQNNKRGS